MTKYQIYFIILVFCFIGCNNNTTVIHNFQKKEWDYRETTAFNININDTSSTYDLSILFSNTLNYQYQNIYLIIETQYKNNIINIDTIHYNITDKYGKWLGKGVGNTKNNYFNYKKKVVFEKTGTYSIGLTHGMRTNPLIGSNSIGLQITQNE